MKDERRQTEEKIKGDTREEKGNEGYGELRIVEVKIAS